MLKPYNLKPVLGNHASFISACTYLVDSVSFHITATSPQMRSHKPFLFRSTWQGIKILFAYFFAVAEYCYKSQMSVTHMNALTNQNHLNQTIGLSVTSSC